LPILCPHTHQPAKHALNDFEQVAPIQECPECHGLIQYCPHCERANCLAAHYCVECGTQLTIPTLVPTQLLRPGEIRQAVQTPSHYSLDSSLQLPAGHRPFMWFSVQEGLLTLSQNRTSRTLPLALHFIPGYRFEIQAGILLTNQFPSYTLWVQQPLVSQQGLFIATEKELQYFPTHGYENIFAPQHWQPSQDAKIRAMALGENGHPLILVSDHNNRLRLLLGNAQSGQWGNQQIDLEKSADEGGYAIAVGKAASESCAIYDGHELQLIDIKQKIVKHTLQLEKAVRPDRLFNESRTKESYFEPFLMGTKGSSVRCIIPIKSVQSDKPQQAGVARFDESHATPTQTQNFSSDAWLLPDPWGIGFTMWSDEAVQRYEGYQPSWQEEGGNFSGVTPLLTPYWFIGQAQMVSGAHYAQAGTEIVVFSTHQSDDRYHINLECRPSLSNVEGSKVVGMPPLQSNGRLFIALRETQDETAPVTVYTMQIAR
jgi:hypothetical protein